MLFRSGQSLDELYQAFASKNDHPLAAMFIAGLREWRRAFEGTNPLRESMIGGVKERIEKAMSVTILREVDGLRYEEIAFSLNIAVGTVKSRLARARKQVQRWLGDLV